MAETVFAILLDDVQREDFWVATGRLFDSMEEAQSWPNCEGSTALSKRGWSGERVGGKQCVIFGNTVPASIYRLTKND